MSGSGTWYGHGHDQALAALASNAGHASFRRQHGEAAARRSGLDQAVNYRFQGDGKGWRVFVTTQILTVSVVTDQAGGAIGLDRNADHLAIAERGAGGNYVKSFGGVPLVTYGKSRHQGEGLICDAVAGVVAYARDVYKPIVLKQLDFRQKKAVLEGGSARHSGMLSSFSYGKNKTCFISRGIGQQVQTNRCTTKHKQIR